MVLKLFKLPRLTWFRPTGVRSSREVVKRTTLAGLLAAALVTAFYWGRHGGLDEARGQSPQTQLDHNFLKNPPSDRSRYVVAYIFGSIPITREELGEYLIERVGGERLEFLVNRKIIEKMCADKNIRVTDVEVNTKFSEELQALNLTESQFVNNILKRYNKSLVEWKEDVIRPKLALRRYVQDTIAIGERDILNGYEAKFGPRVECRIIAISREHEGDKWNIWGRAKGGLTEFEAEAKRINPGPLAAEAGKVPAIHKHFPDPNIEEQAFKLKPGEISPLVGLPDGTTVILYCVKHIGADTTKSVDKERAALHKEIFDQRVEQRVKEIFPEMKKAANPQVFLKREVVAADMPPISNYSSLNNQLPQASQTPPMPPSAPGATSPAMPNYVPPAPGTGQQLPLFPPTVPPTGKGPGI